MINLVRSKPVAAAMFFHVCCRAFREQCCGFSGPYSQDYDGNVPRGFFGPLDAVTGKPEESGRKALHLHGHMISRLVKLHDVQRVMEAGEGRVLKWMANVGCCVMNNMVVGLMPDGGITHFKQAIVEQGMTEPPEYITFVPEALRYELPKGCVPEREKQEWLTRFQQSLQLHEHATRCPPPHSGGKADDTNCAMGFRPGPDNVPPPGVWDADRQHLLLPRSRTKIVAHSPVCSLGFKSNNCFAIMGNKTTRQVDDGMECLKLADEAALSCYYTTEYASKKDALDGEETVANMVAAHTLTLEERGAGRTDPKLTITRCVNAMQRCESLAPRTRSHTNERCLHSEERAY